MRKNEQIYQCISSGNSEDINRLQRLLDSDPSRNLYTSSDSKHIINKPLWNMQTPLYVACKYGNLECLKALLKGGANPMIKSRVSESEEESILSVSVRWSKL
jgi:ankyrin repeat protein